MCSKDTLFSSAGEKKACKTFSALKQSMVREEQMCGLPMMPTLMPLLDQKVES